MLPQWLRTSPLAAFWANASSVYDGGQFERTGYGVYGDLAFQVHVIVDNMTCTADDEASVRRQSRPLLHC